MVGRWSTPNNAGDASRTPPAYATLAAVLYRVHRCHALMADCCAGAGDVARRYRLQLLVDTHLPLCDFMRRSGLYADAELQDPMRNNDDLVLPAAQQYAPRDVGAVAHCGDLPDLTPLVDKGNVWYDVRPKAREETMIGALIHILSKTQPHKCQLRNFMRILRRYFAMFAPMVALFRAVIEVALLGNYPHAAHRPRFETRVHLYASFRSGALTDDLLFKWMMENEQVVYYATKEYYTFLVECQYALDVMLCATGHWREIKRCTVRAMDIARTALDSGAEREREPFLAVERDLKQIHQQSLPWLTKLCKGTFVDMLVQEMARYYEKHVVNKRSTSAQSSERALADAAGYGGDDGDDEQQRCLLDDMRLVVEQRFPAHQQNALELRWLKVFGISRTGLDAVRRLYVEYERRTVADNAIARRIGGIYEERAYDFHLLRVFFGMVHRRRSFACYRLSSDYAERQRDALRRRLSLAPWEALPPEADTFHYCTACRRWLHPVVDPQKPKSALNVYAQGFEKALYDHETRTVYCGKQKTQIGVRKLMESGAYYREGEIDDAKDARVIRRHKETRRCCDTPVSSVSMIGTCQKLGGKMWALCEVCASLTPWEGAKLGPLGFTCGQHARRRAAAAAAASSDDAAVPDHLRRCYYCSAPTVAATAPLRRVLDDRSDVLRYADARFCDTHDARCRWLFREGTHVVLRSALFARLLRISLREGTIAQSIKLHFVEE